MFFEKWKKVKKQIPCEFWEKVKRFLREEIYLKLTFETDFFKTKTEIKAEKQK